MMKFEPVYRKGVVSVIGIHVVDVGLIVYDAADSTVVSPEFQVPLVSVVSVVDPILISRFVKVVEVKVPMLEGFR
jgi:hypothetical protein